MPRLHFRLRTMRLAFLACALAMVASLLALPAVAHAVSVRTTPPEAGNKWFYSNTNPYYAWEGLAPKPERVDGAYVIGNCTWYAWGRASEMLGSAIELSASDPLGMLQEARRSGIYQTGGTPRVGALCVGYSGYGNPHVSVVERVLDGKAYVSESGYRTSQTWPGYSEINFHYGLVDSWMSSGIEGYIYVLDGDASSDDGWSSDSEEVEELESDSWERIYGQGAYDTMMAVLQSDDAFVDGRGGTVIVATGDGYWDALAASGLAGLFDAPIVITSKDRLVWQAADELERLDPDRVLVMGGESALSEQVVSSIERICPDVERVWGEGAPETACEIYARGDREDSWSDTAIVATSKGYWDALSIAPYAFASASPVFLASGSDNTLSADTLAAIEEGGFDRVVITGGPLAVSYEVEDQLEEVGIYTVERLWGDNALETSSEIALWELSYEGMGQRHLSIATSGGYWDALTAAPVAGKANSVLVLVSGNDLSAFEDVCEPDLVVHGHVLGGPLAIAVETWNDIVSAT